MNVDLDKLEQLARAATPGPWADVPVFPDGFTGTAQSGWSISHGYDRLAELDVAHAADAAFIAAANPAAMLELVRRLRAAERQADQGTEAARQLFRLEGKASVLEGIVRDLAARHRVYEENQARGFPCQNCDGVWGDHRENCTGVRAVEATKP